MNKLDQLAVIIDGLEEYRNQLIVDRHLEWADKVARTAQDLFWLYHEMSMFASENSRLPFDSNEDGAGG